MWSFGHKVREIERSRQRAVYEETATWGAVLVFSVPAFVILVLDLLYAAGDVGTVIPALFFASLALYASVSSTFTADHARRNLGIERRILLWKIRRVYEAGEVDRIFVRHTKKGSGLAMQLASGRKKDLTLSLDFAAASLEEAAAALNHFLHVSKSH